MNRFLVVGLLGLLAVGLTIGVTGSQTMTAERGVDVAVVDDETAFLDVTACDGNGTTTVTVTNQFDDPLTVTELVANGTVAGAAGTTIGPGEGATFTVDRNATSVELTVDGPASVSIERQATECA